jgi:hypothetical protein
MDTVIGDSGNPPLADPALPGIVKRLRKASVAVYLAAEEGPADDLSDMLRLAADTLDAQARALAEKDALVHGPDWKWVRVSDQMVAELSGGPSQAVTIEVREAEGRDELELICARVESELRTLREALTAAEQQHALALREARAETWAQAAELTTLYDGPSAMAIEKTCRQRATAIREDRTP